MFNGTVEIQRSKWIFPPLFFLFLSAFRNGAGGTGPRASSRWVSVNITSFWRKQQFAGLFVDNGAGVYFGERFLCDTVDWTRDISAVKTVSSAYSLLNISAWNWDCACQCLPRAARQIQHNSLTLLALIKRTRVFYRAMDIVSCLFHYAVALSIWRNVQKHLVTHLRRVQICTQLFRTLVSALSTNRVHVT